MYSRFTIFKLKCYRIVNIKLLRRYTNLCRGQNIVICMFARIPERDPGIVMYVASTSVIHIRDTTSVLILS
jgi:hypothetical protein